jgi:hypothetical protein
VPALLSDGGYIPMLDGRVRIDIPFDNYVYYKRLLEKNDLICRITKPTIEIDLKIYFFIDIQDYLK